MILFCKEFITDQSCQCEMTEFMFVYHQHSLWVVYPFSNSSCIGVIRTTSEGHPVEISLLVLIRCEVFKNILTSIMIFSFVEYTT